MTTLFAKLTAVVPLMAWALVSKVAPPAVKATPLLTIPPLNTRLADAATVELKVPVKFTEPTNKSIPVVLLLVKLPDRKSTRLNSSHLRLSRMPSSA